jgi:hypothetical protein
MWPLVVVVLDVFLTQVIEMVPAERNEVVQAFLLNRLNEPGNVAPEKSIAITRFCQRFPSAFQFVGNLAKLELHYIAFSVSWTCAASKAFNSVKTTGFTR